MRNVRKIIFSALFFLFLISGAFVHVHAQGEDGIGLSVKQVINLAEQNSSIRYNFQIHNNSEDFVDEFKFVPGIDESQGRDEIVINFKNDPIAPGATRTFNINLTSPDLVEIHGDYKKVLIPKFSTRLNLSAFDTEVNYSDSWGTPAYSSLIANNNSEIYMFWGKSIALNYSLDIMISGDGENFAYPFFMNNSKQEVYLNDFSGVNSIVSNQSGSYLILDDSHQIRVDGTFVLVGFKGDVSNIDDPGVEKISQIVEKLKKNLKLNTQRDKFEFCVDFAKELNTSGYDSEAFLGFDLRGMTTKNIDTSCWIEYRNGDTYNILDPIPLVSGDASAFHSRNFDRIKILNLSSLSRDSKLFDSNFLQYHFEYSEQSPSNDEKITKAEISLLTDNENCKINTVGINLYNPTNQIIWLVSPEERSEGILPGQKIGFELSKKDLRKQDYKITYLIGNKEVSKELKFKDENCSVSLGITEQSRNIILLALSIFLFVLIISRIASRPNARFIL